MTFVFLKLVLAHLIADFILQFEELYRLKLKSLTGHMLHALLHGLVSLVLLFPLLASPLVWVFVVTLTVVHLIQDLIKYTLQERYPAFVFPIYVADQAVHFAVLALIFFIPMNPPPPPISLCPILDKFYREQAWTLMGIVFILTTFTASYTFHNFRKNYLKDTRPDHYITSFEMAHALLERSFLTLVFLFAYNPAWFLAAPAIGCLRLFHPKLRNRFDFILSFLWAAAAGLLFRRWIP